MLKPNKTTAKSKEHIGKEVLGELKHQDVYFIIFLGKYVKLTNSFLFYISGRRENISQLPSSIVIVLWYISSRREHSPTR